jgi:uncharacterized phiE125 gp8 family phage protein
MITSSSPIPYGNRHLGVVTEPSSEPITVDELKLWARIDGDDEDTMIEGLIKTVRKFAEDYTRRSFITQTRFILLDTWYSNDIELPHAPVSAVTAVQIISESGDITVYDSDNYYILTEAEPARLIIKSGVANPLNDSREHGGYKIIYTCGYGGVDDVPDGIKEGLKLWATHIYENRVPANKMPPEAKQVLFPFKTLRA